MNKATLDVAANLKQPAPVALQIRGLEPVQRTVKLEMVGTGSPWQWFPQHDVEADGRLTGRRHLGEESALAEDQPPAGGFQTGIGTAGRLVSHARVCHQPLRLGPATGPPYGFAGPVPWSSDRVLRPAASGLSGAAGWQLSSAFIPRAKAVFDSSF